MTQNHYSLININHFGIENFPVINIIIYNGLFKHRQQNTLQSGQ